MHAKVMKSLICKGCLNPITSTGRTSADIGASANLELVDTFCYLGDMLSVDGDADAAVGTELDGINSGVGTIAYQSLVVRARLYSNCVRSSVLHGSETSSIRKQNEVVLERAEMRMVRWMCGIELQDRVPSKGL